MKLASTWADHQPAFFMATHAARKEVVVAVRGTAQLEDVVTDLTALPEARPPAPWRGRPFASMQGAFQTLVASRGSGAEGDLSCCVDAPTLLRLSMFSPAADAPSTAVQDDLQLSVLQGSTGRLPDLCEYFP